jgi:hypothetical protein
MQASFRKLCELEADLSGLARSLQPRRSAQTGQTYYKVDYQVAMFFGGTTLKARLQWFEEARSIAMRYHLSH